MGDNEVRSSGISRWLSKREIEVKPGLLKIDLDNCNGCGDCIRWCPTGAVKLVNGKAIVVSPEKCNYCADCETVCPYGAIHCPFEIILMATRLEPEEKR